MKKTIVPKCRRLGIVACFALSLASFSITSSRGALVGDASLNDGSASTAECHQSFLAAAIPFSDDSGLSSINAVVLWLGGVLGAVGVGLWLWSRRKKYGLRSQYRTSDFSLVAEKSDNAILVLNEAGRIEWINVGFTKVTGYVPKEAVGKLPGSLLAGADPNTSANQTIREGLASRRNFCVEVFSRHAQGHRTWLSLNFTPVFGDRKSLTHFVVVANDITARKRAEEALSRASRNNELILNAMNEGVCGMDINGLVTFINSAAARMTGWKVSDIIGKPVSCLLYQLKTDGMPDVEVDHFLRVAFKDGKVLVGDCDLFLRHDGNQFPVTYSKTPIYEADQVVGAVMVFRDISEQKQSEGFRARQGRHYALRAEVGFALATGDSQSSFLGACARSFLKALDAACCRIWVFNPVENTLELEASAGLVSGTMDSILSVPLGTMKIGKVAKDRVANLTNDLPNDPDEVHKEWVKQEGLVAFVGLPLTLEGQLLAVVGVYSRTNLPSDTIDLLSSVSDTIGQGILRKRAESKSVEQANLLDRTNDAILVLDLGGRLTYWNDKARQMHGWNTPEVIGQPFDKCILRNRGEFLRIKNEVFSRGEWISQSSHQTQDGKGISVRTHWSAISDGEGNPKSLCGIIPGIRFEAESASLPGEHLSTGHPCLQNLEEFTEVYASIQSKLKDLGKYGHQPEVMHVIETLVERGANILKQLQLPIGHKGPSNQGELPRGHGECILLVDDEQSDLEKAGALLANWGYRVMTANDGTDAIAVYSKHREEIDLVITDLAMPHMDGVATIRTFKQLNPQLPIIVVSSPNDQRELRDSVLLENVAMQDKPLSEHRLLPILSLALSQNAEHDEAESASQAA